MCLQLYIGEGPCCSSFSIVVGDLSLIAVNADGGLGRNAPLRIGKRYRIEPSLAGCKHYPLQ